MTEEEPYFNIKGCQISELANSIYKRAIEDYHLRNDVDSKVNVVYSEKSFLGLLYRKCWIDTVQWHLEDEIRKINLEPSECLSIKRRIDKSNQDRTDIVELIDDYILSQYADITPMADAKLNTESPAWALDRLSILNLKIFHMRAEFDREDVPNEHYSMCQKKLNILNEQLLNLSESIDELHGDIASGFKKMKVYRQLKMYNDPNLNPIIYKFNSR